MKTWQEMNEAGIKEDQEIRKGLSLFKNSNLPDLLGKHEAISQDVLRKDQATMFFV